MQTGVLTISRREACLYCTAQQLDARALYGYLTVYSEGTALHCSALVAMTAVMRMAGMQVDGCFADPTQYNVTYPGLGLALNKTGRAMVYSCSWPAYLPDPVQTSYQVSASLLGTGQAFDAWNCCDGRESTRHFLALCTPCSLTWLAVVTPSPEAVMCLCRRPTRSCSSTATCGATGWTSSPAGRASAPLCSSGPWPRSGQKDLLRLRARAHGMTPTCSSLAMRYDRLSPSPVECLLVFPC